MPRAGTTHQWTATDDALEVSGQIREVDHPLTWLRDEEAAGPNPATPTHKTAGHNPFGDLPLLFSLSQCPILGAKWEPGPQPCKEGFSRTTFETQRWPAE
jgi:hypothetical protein